MMHPKITAGSAINSRVWEMTLIATIALFLSFNSSLAQQSEIGNVCVGDYGGASCTANDMDIGVGQIIQEIEPCTSIGDTGEYIFQFEFSSNAQTRYDIGVYVALDGGSGNTGDMCYHSLLDPVVSPATHDPDGGPYYNPDMDSCGEVLQGELTRFVTESLVIECVDTDMDGIVDPINTCTSWSTPSNQCDDVTDAGPIPGSKCRCEDVEIGVTIRSFEICKALDITGDGNADITGDLSANDTRLAGFEFEVCPDGIPSGDPSCTLGTTDNTGCVAYPNVAAGASFDVFETVEDNGLGFQFFQTDIGGDCTFDGVSGEIDLSNDPAVLQRCIVTNSADNPLSVEMAEFVATSSDQGILLEWTTSSETNNHGFEIEYRNHLENDFKREGFVAAVESSDLGASYEFLLSDLKPGSYDFRLKQVDFDGTFEYHGNVEAAVDIPGKVFIDDLYPNPFSGSTSMRIGVKESSNVVVQLFNNNGQMIREVFQGTLDENVFREIRIDADNLSAGSYFVRVFGDGIDESRALHVVR